MMHVGPGGVSYLEGNMDLLLALIAQLIFKVSEALMVKSGRKQRQEAAEAERKRLASMTPEEIEAEQWEREAEQWEREEEQRRWEELSYFSKDM